MSYDYLADYIPKNKSDYESIVQLYELTDEEIKVIADKLLEWMQDSNWPIAYPMSIFIISRQGLFIDRIRELLKAEQDDDIWKSRIIDGLIPYFTLENQEKLIHSVERIVVSPSPVESGEAFEVAVDTVSEYRRRKERCSGYDMTRNLYLMPYEDVRHVVRGILRNFTAWEKGASERAFIIGKQDLFVDDVREVYRSDEYDKDYKDLLYDRLIRWFTKENQEKICEGGVEAKHEQQ